MNEIVSNCPVCNAPIYGPRLIPADWTPPKVVFSCDCRPKLQALIVAKTQVLTAQAPPLVGVKP